MFEVMIRLNNGDVIHGKADRAAAQLFRFRGQVTIWNANIKYRAKDKPESVESVIVHRSAVAWTVDM